MRHPFAGVDVATQDQVRTEEVSRRQALGRMVFSTAGLFGASALASGQAAAPPVVAAPIQITTLAEGEEGARLRQASATTAPFGEEAGKVTSFVVPGLEDGGTGKPLTRALNEQGGRPPLTQAINEGGVTTDALNEEGGVKPLPRTEAVNEGGIKIQPPPQPVPLQPIKEDRLQIQVQPAPAQGKPVQIQLQPIKGKPIQVQPAPIQVAPPVATTLAIGEEGGATRARGEAGLGGPVVIVPPMARDLTTQQLDALWTQLGDKNEAVGLQACAAIYGSKQAIAFLKGKLKSSIKAADTDLVARLIKDLDNDSFDVREKAAKDLANLGVAALPALQEVMNQPASAEVHARIRRLLDQSKDMPAFLQLQRGVEVLVALKNDEAKSLAQELSKEKPATLVTALASQALPRMK